MRPARRPRQTAGSTFARDRRSLRGFVDATEPHPSGRARGRFRPVGGAGSARPWPVGRLPSRVVSSSPVPAPVGVARTFVQARKASLTRTLAPEIVTVPTRSTSANTGTRATPTSNLTNLDRASIAASPVCRPWVRRPPCGLRRSQGGHARSRGLPVSAPRCGGDPAPPPPAPTRAPDAFWRRGPLGGPGRQPILTEILRALNSGFTKAALEWQTMGASKSKSRAGTSGRSRGESARFGSSATGSRFEPEGGA